MSSRSKRLLKRNNKKEKSDDKNKIQLKTNFMPSLQSLSENNNFVKLLDLNYES